MAEIQWKGFDWKGAYSDLSIKELLTTLKGFGTMEILAFEKPGEYRGLLSIALSPQGEKVVTLYELQIVQGMPNEASRDALDELRGAIGGQIQVVSDPSISLLNHADSQSLLFWGRMFREGKIDGLDSERLSLDRGMSDGEVERLLEQVHEEEEQGEES